MIEFFLISFSECICLVSDFNLDFLLENGVSIWANYCLVEKKVSLLKGTARKSRLWFPNLAGILPSEAMGVKEKNAERGACKRSCDF